MKRRKARIVTRRFSQRPGVDFNDISDPPQIRFVAALVAQNNMKIHQLDVNTAYLNGELEEQIFIKFPKFSERILEEIAFIERKGKVTEKARSMLQALRSGDKVL